MTHPSPSPLSEVAFALRGNLRVIHQVPGRVRIRFQRPARGTLKDLPPLATVVAALEQWPAVRSVRLSPATGSVVIDYDRHHLPEDFWSILLTAPEDVARAALHAAAPPSAA